LNLKKKVPLNFPVYYLITVHWDMCQNAATIDGHLKTSQSYLHEWFIKMILFIHKRNYVYIKYEKDYIFMNFLQGLHFSRTSLVCFSLYYFNNVPCHFPKFMILFICSRYKCVYQI